MSARRGIEIDGAVAVVTGASSGISRATALALAERGASVVLAARSDEDLDEVAAACEQAGGKALAVPTDVSRPDEVDHLAREARERFGRFDVWINGAAVMAYGAFWGIPVETHRHIIETNLFGTIHGCRVALDHFRERGRGVVINIDSLYGRITSPYVSPYVVSKFGVRGLTKSLRQETAPMDSVDVCAVLPQAVDTPIFRHAGNYTGQQVTALPLTADPQRVVRTVLRCIERPKAEVVVGVSGRLFAWGAALLPRMYEWAAPQAMDAAAMRGGDVPPDPGNVFEPEPGLNQIDGGWRQQRRTLRRATAAGMAVAAAAPLATWLWRRRSA